MLYIVGTPIGNLSDISNRAISVLSNVDYILCEDTRVSEKLLQHINVHAKLVVYNDHNAAKTIEKISDSIKNGQDYALISDAGMPCISDPGYKLVQFCIKNNIKHSVIPGPSAVISALVLSGLPSDRFTFVGFANVKKFAEIAKINSTIIMFEAPTRILKTLIDMEKYFSDRQIAVVKEITKIFEETILGSIKQVIETLASKKICGEFVIVIEPPRSTKKQDFADYHELFLDLSQKMPITDISAIFAKHLKTNKNAIYNYIKQIRNKII